MAISFDANSGSTDAGGISSLTTSHTCSAAANRALFVYIETENAAGEKITGVTYGGIAMTQLIKQDFQATDGSWHYIYGLLGPASGANNVVVSVSSSSIIRSRASSFVGVNSTQVLPDSSNSAVSASSSNLTTSLTTVANGSWIFAGGYIGAGVNSAGTNLTIRATGNDAKYNSYSSSAAISPAGSTTIGVTSTVAGHATIIGVSFAPDNGVPNFLFFF